MAHAGTRNKAFLRRAGETRWLTAKRNTSDARAPQRELLSPDRLKKSDRALSPGERDPADVRFYGASTATRVCGNASSRERRIDRRAVQRAEAQRSVIMIVEWRTINCRTRSLRFMPVQPE